jgi:hypothetical protein
MHPNAEFEVTGIGPAAVQWIVNAELDAHYAQLYPEVVAGEYVLLSIPDTGTGMTPEFIERAIEPFFNEGTSEGHQSRAQHGVRLCETIRRPFQHLQRAWHRYDDAPLFAAIP